MTRLMLVIALGAGLAGCSTVQRVNPFALTVPDAPLPYRASLDGSRRSPDFAVRVQTRGAPIDAWRESARFPATRHCLKRFGSSEIDWVLRPDGTDWAVSMDAGGTATLRGRCLAR